MSDFYSRRLYSGSVGSPPTRDDILGINGGLITFQGLIVDTDQFGRLPGFEACIAWLNSSDRQKYWAAKKVAGDTHALVQLPFGPPLYDEPNQPYSADRFGPLDWTNSGTRIDSNFTSLLRDTVQAGFNKIFLFLGGDGVSGYPIASKHLELLSQNNEYYNELYKYCVVIPGWDGVFYGWPDVNQIVNWSKQFRSIWPTGHLGLEHDEGHIPLGEGGDDYQPGGRMQHFDLILSEYAQDLHKDSCWQINGRLVKDYKRPPDQPNNDDPTPPYYLRTNNARGPWGHCAFENGEYEYVRSGCSPESVKIVQDNRDYQYSMNCKFTG